MKYLNKDCGITGEKDSFKVQFNKYEFENNNFVIGIYSKEECDYCMEELRKFGYEWGNGNALFNPYIKDDLNIDKNGIYLVYKIRGKIVWNNINCFNNNKYGGIIDYKNIDFRNIIDKKTMKSYGKTIKYKAKEIVRGIIKEILTIFNK